MKNMYTSLKALIPVWVTACLLLLVSQCKTFENNGKAENFSLHILMPQAFNVSDTVLPAEIQQLCASFSLPCKKNTYCYAGPVDMHRLGFSSSEDLNLATKVGGASADPNNNVLIDHQVKDNVGHIILTKAFKTANDTNYDYNSALKDYLASQTMPARIIYYCVKENSDIPSGAICFSKPDPLKKYIALMICDSGVVDFCLVFNPPPVATAKVTQKPIIQTTTIEQHISSKTPLPGQPIKTVVKSTYIYQIDSTIIKEYERQLDEKNREIQKFKEVVEQQSNENIKLKSQLVDAGASAQKKSLEITELIEKLKTEPLSADEFNALSKEIKDKFNELKKELDKNITPVIEQRDPALNLDSILNAQASAMRKAFEEKSREQRADIYYSNGMDLCNKARMTNRIFNKSRKRLAESALSNLENASSLGKDSKNSITAIKKEFGIE